jgi:hypothetical protein
MTITLPNGEKVRSQSRRRYVLVVKHGDHAPKIIKRSDRLETIRWHQRNVKKINQATPAWAIDNQSGEVLV